MARYAPRVFPLLVAIVAVVVAALARAQLDPLLGQSEPFITFFAAVAVAAWYGGQWPGLLSILLSCIAAGWLFVPSPLSLHLLVRDTVFLAQFTIFVAMSGVIVALCDALHRAHVRSQAEARHAAQEAKFLQITLSSIGDAVIATNTEGRVTFMNPVAESLTGWQSVDAHNRPLTEIFCIVEAQTRDTAEDPCSQVMRTEAVVGMSNHTVLIAKDGTERPIDDSAAPIRLEKGEVVGVVLIFRDVTQRREYEQQLRTSEARKAAIIRSALDCIIKIDHEDRILEFNPAAEQTFGYRRDNVLGRKMVDLIIPPSLRDHHRQAIADYLATGEGPSCGKRIQLTGVRADGREFPMELSITRSPIDGPPLFTAFLRDITERKREEAALEFLAETSATLATLVDRESALQQATEAMVPFFADWCVLYIVSPEGSIEPQACAHRDPEKNRLLQEMLREYPFDWNAPSASVQALRTGKTQFAAELPDVLLANIARDEAHLDSIRALDPKSVVSVPLQIRGRSIGTISFVASGPGRRYAPCDIPFAEDLGRRLATAIDNAQLLKSLKEGDRQKDEFLAMLAHELRNPLAAISYATEIARMPEVHSKDELFEMVERQVQNLAHLIDDLLDISRISRDRIELRKEHLDAATIARQATATVYPLIEEKNHQLAIEIVDEPMPIHADATRTEQIITNLLTNAAKYTPHGGHISLRVWPEDSEAVIRVTDSGVGIARDMLPRVFELFSQADATLDRTQGGLGIGLTVARKLAEMHGGTIAASSQGVGHGSEFTVRLPLDQNTLPETVDGSLPAAETPTPLRLLVVDDNRDSAEIEALLLKAHGHQVRVTHDGPTAVEMARRYRPNAILLDIGLPGMNGYEVAKKLREQGFTKELLIAISGYGRSDDRERAQAAGFDAHLTKPVDSQELLAILHDVSNRAHGKPPSGQP